MFAITPAQMIAADFTNAQTLLGLLETRLALLMDNDHNAIGQLDHYSFTIEKVKSDFTACGYPVTDTYDREGHTRERTTIRDDIEHPAYGRLTHEILYLSDDDDEYLDDLRDFISSFRLEIQNGHGKILAHLAYHTEIRRRIVANKWVTAVSFPAARLLGATVHAKGKAKLTLDTSIKMLSQLTPEDMKTRFSNDHLLNRLRPFHNDIGKVVTHVIDDQSDYNRINFNKQFGVITLNWHTTIAIQNNSQIILGQIPQIAAAALAGKNLDEVIDHPLARRLGIKIVSAETNDMETKIQTDEKERHNLIILERPLD